MDGISGRCLIQGNLLLIHFLVVRIVSANDSWFLSAHSSYTLDYS